MTIHAKCPRCATVLKLNPGMAGKKGKCARCGAVLTVPKLAAGTAGQGQPLETPTAAATAPVVATRTSLPTPAAAAVTEAAFASAAATPTVVASATNPPSELQVDRVLPGKIDRVKKPFTYGFGILAVTCLMITLPLIYIALIGLTGYGVYYHLVNHTEMLEYGRGRGKLFVALAYVAPGIVGGILVLFMIKPLFARPANQVRTRSLTRTAEPLLFAFVARLCQIVGAPEPKRIHVDYQLNASAGFRRGWLSLFGSDLVLTIGIPLAAGLTLRQFTGVLAHEFGHFSQGTGMRLTYVARSINAWFARVVYERDQWDAWLASTAAETDFRIGWVLMLSQLFVMLSRRVLWLLMMIGHTVSGFMLRQMEFDADRYETRVAGSDTFAATTKRMRELGAAYQLTQHAVIGFLTKGSFPDNLSQIMLKLSAEMPDKLRREMNKSFENERTGLLDTHPCDKDRVASAQKENAAGIVGVDGSAASLFSNFDSLAKNVTWDLYCVMGARIKPQDMKPVEKLFSEAQQKQPEQEATIRLD